MKILKILPLLLAFFAPCATLAQQPSATEISLISLGEDTPPPRNNDIPFEALKTFVDVFDTIKKNYVSEVSNQTLMEHAIRGMLARLDPHSAYMNADEFERFKQESEGEFAGIGVVLDIKAGSISVVSAIEGSPAARAGIATGDIILQINGQNIADLTLMEIDQLLDGDIGSNVSLTIQRDDNIYQHALTRETIHANSVSSSVLATGYVAIKISQFQEDTAEMLEKEIESLKVKYELSGIILDLRGNPGGYLDSAVDSADLFLDNGLIVSVRGRDNSIAEEFHATGGDLLDGIPMLALVDEGSASGAEILAGALQDSRRALVVGQPTFGKGSVQTITPLYHGGAVKMTTARYYTPKGHSIQSKGIAPDVHLSPLAVSARENIEQRESSYPNRLDADNSPKPAGNNDSQTRLAEHDFSLYEALNILKAISILPATLAAPAQPQG
ncbi:MAG: S41 family peptidase [Cardiobacteriaceae bacterium]|nr:S41 family peptidase [Cardiobacteriaceae bacterium]